jgi:hypothetical protein
MKKILNLHDDASTTKIALVVIAFYSLVFTVTFLAW